MEPADQARHHQQQRAAYQTAERAAKAALPVDRAQLERLVEYVQGRLLVENCDHTRRLSQQWAEEHQIDWPVLAGCFDTFGGYCDCEVVMNCCPEVVFE